MWTRGGASRRAEWFLVLPMEPECSGYEGEPTPVGGTAKSCAEECVCACLHGGRAVYVSFPTTWSSCESGSRMRVVSVGSGAQPGMGTGCLLVAPLPRVHPRRLSFIQSKPYPACFPLSSHLCILHAQSSPALSLGVFPVVRLPVLFKS